MNAVETAVVEQSAPIVETEPVEEAAPLSILEHAAVHGPAPKDETPEQAEERIQKAHHSAQQRRERETGKFTEGRVRHRAKSQQASPEDVPRIRELTGKLRETETRLQTAERELATLRQSGAPQAQIAKAEAKVERAEQAAPTARPSAATTFSEPEPQEDDPKFAGDYAKYLRAAAAWEGRKAYHDAREGERQQEATQRFNTDFDAREKAVIEKHPDFHAVMAPIWDRIPKFSVVEQYGLTRKAGLDVLYHLGQHPQELDAILQMPDGADQFEALTLLAQRLASPTASAAVSTTSAPERTTKIVLPPKPANVVRTEAQRASDGPPPTDGTLSVMGHAKAFRRP